MNNISITRAAPRMRTINETAKETGFPAHAIRQLVKENKIVFVQCGAKALVNVEKFIEYLNEGERGVVLYDSRLKDCKRPQSRRRKRREPFRYVQDIRA